MIKQPLYNHTSFETAYQVDNYPYGWLRCKIWFWLEFGGENKGYRFCSRTQNPKNDRMNAPKLGTYTKIAANMYLDENDHVQWAVLSEYSSGQEILDFANNFPQSQSKPRLKNWVSMKIKYNELCLEKKKTPYGEADIQDKEKETKLLKQALEKLVI